MRKETGMTLIEMLTALAIIAVLATAAAPGFSDLIASSGRAAAVNAFLHGLFLARSEAIKRAEVVSLCPSADRQTCSRGAAWRDGWIVFVNTNRDQPPQRDPDEPLLTLNEGWAHGHIASNRPAYSFRPYAQSAVNGTITFCDRRGAAHARAIIISQTGRPRLTQRDASDRPLRCPSSWR
jgi:type IV fimbrial biogenesis protein FimT